jgi:hypothetical protein
MSAKCYSSPKISYKRANSGKDESRTAEAKAGVGVKGQKWPRDEERRNELRQG